MGEALREAYVDPEYLAAILQREGFDGTAKLLEERFPSTENKLAANVRIGDFGEVITQAVFKDLYDLQIPVIKIRYKTNWDKAAFGVDVIAFRLNDTDPTGDSIVFAEVKASSQKSYGVRDVFEEVEDLATEGQSETRQKMRNAVRFVSERLFEQGQHELEQRIYRFLDCYTNPEFVEAFVPFLVRDKRTWGEDALEGITLNSLDPDNVRLFIFLVDDMGKAVRAAYELAAKVGLLDG